MGRATSKRRSSLYDSTSLSSIAANKKATETRQQQTKDNKDFSNGSSSSSTSSLDTSSSTMTKDKKQVAALEKFMSHSTADCLPLLRNNAAQQQHQHQKQRN